jgi:hypothetical protein
VAVCGFCGRVSNSAEPSDDTAAGEVPEEIPLTWVRSVENGKARVYCDACARTHLRSIESKLDAEWW